MIFILCRLVLRDEAQHHAGCIKMAWFCVWFLVAGHVGLHASAQPTYFNKLSRTYIAPPMCEVTWVYTKKPLVDYAHQFN